MNLTHIQQPFLAIFPCDYSYHPGQRSIPKYIACTVQPAVFPNPEFIFYNEKLAHQLALGEYQSQDLNFLTAQNLPSNIKPYSTAYAGHQFGNWAGQLGDGRAIYAGTIQLDNGKTYELQWKGAGATPFSRRGDGRAVLRSSVREFLMSEAMHHLGIPTTRALSLCKTGENVIRDILYNGNPQAEPGAVIIRTAESFLRFGHFEWFSAQNEIETLKKLLDFTIQNYFPEIEVKKENKYKEYFKIITKKTADLIVAWQRVGFVHGVMNTDNMSAIGLTIDYGPFGMLEEYNEEYTPNTTDIPGRRYAFGAQAQIAQWNLWKLANALFPLINDADFLGQELESYNDYFLQKQDEMNAHKLGFEKVDASIITLLDFWQEMMNKLQPDYTLFFSKLETWEYHTSDKDHFNPCFCKSLDENEQLIVQEFLEQYAKLLLEKNITEEQRKERMSQTNPKFVLRNYLLFECIEELKMGNMKKFHQLFEAIQNPYHCTDETLLQKRPERYNDQPGCSTLSCSS